LHPRHHRRLLSSSTPLSPTPTSVCITIFDPGPKHAAVNHKHALLFSTPTESTQPPIASMPSPSSTLASELTSVLDSIPERTIVDVKPAVVIDLKHAVVVDDLNPAVDTSFVSLVHPLPICECLYD
jgi:hypothetical protein